MPRRIPDLRERLRESLTADVEPFTITDEQWDRPLAEHPRVFESAPTTADDGLLTIRDVAQIIGESYHTTRNMALRGDFGEIVRSLMNGATTFVSRDGVQSYFRTAIADAAATLEQLTDRYDDLTGEVGADPDDQTDLDDDVTDDMHQMSEAFQNVANAFEAMQATLDLLRDEQRGRDETFIERVNRLENSYLAPSTASPFRADVLLASIQYDVEHVRFIIANEALDLQFGIHATSLYLTDDAIAQIIRLNTARILEALPPQYRPSIPQQHRQLAESNPVPSLDVATAAPPPNPNWHWNVVRVPTAGAVADIPQASAVDLGVSTIDLPFGGEAEILHPARFVTGRLYVVDGRPEFLTNAVYFRILNWHSNYETRMTTVTWQGV